MTGGTAVRKRISRDTSQTAASKKFSRYKKEEEKTVRKPDVKEDKALGQLKKAWRAYKTRSTDYGEVENFLKARDLNYSSKDIERFSIALVEFQDEQEFSDKAGLFLSVLINNGKDSDYVIHTRHLAEAIDSIGRDNRKNIIVDGDVGDFAGLNMQSGSITIRGNASDFLGAGMKEGMITVEGNVGKCLGQMMKGGNITVGGNAGGVLGNQMKGGAITVKGNAGELAGNLMEDGSITVGGNVGDNMAVEMRKGMIRVGGNAGKRIGGVMRGGEIHIEGDFESIDSEKIDDTYGGRIYHKGKLIFSK